MSSTLCESKETGRNDINYQRSNVEIGADWGICLWKVICEMWESVCPM